MQFLKNCFSVLKDYWHTPKGRHDIIEYGRCLALFVFICAVLTLAVSYFTM